jgi:hypothetical protein
LDIFGGHNVSYIEIPEQVGINSSYTDCSIGVELETDQAFVIVEYPTWSFRLGDQ